MEIDESALFVDGQPCLLLPCQEELAIVFSFFVPARSGCRDKVVSLVVNAQSNFSLVCEPLRVSSALSFRSFIVSFLLLLLLLLLLFPLFLVSLVLVLILSISSPQLPSNIGLVTLPFSTLGGEPFTLQGINFLCPSPHLPPQFSDASFFLLEVVIDDVSPCASAAERGGWRGAVSLQLRPCVLCFLACFLGVALFCLCHTLVRSRCCCYSFHLVALPPQPPTLPTRSLPPSPRTVGLSSCSSGRERSDRSNSTFPSCAFRHRRAIGVSRQQSGCRLLQDFRSRNRCSLLPTMVSGLCFGV